MPREDGVKIDLAVRPGIEKGGVWITSCKR
jgi:hypothetical protein